MKRILSVALLCGALWGCSQKDESTEWTLPESGELTQIVMNINPSSLNITRGFLEDVTNAAVWENEINSAHIFIFNGSGELVARRELSADDRSVGMVRITVPRAEYEQEYTFFVAANMPVDGFDTTSEIKFSNAVCATYATAMSHNYAQQLINGYPMTSTGSYTPMSGKARIIVKPDVSYYQINIPLERLTAKIAIETYIDEEFSTKHGGSTLTLYRVGLSRFSNQSYAFPKDNGDVYNGQTAAYTQTPYFDEGIYKNLFYTYEMKDNQNPLMLTFRCLFDLDGDPDTTDDREFVLLPSIPVDYVTGEGIISRNHIYRLSVRIMGIGANNIDVSWSTEPWYVHEIHEHQYDN